MRTSRWKADWCHDDLCIFSLLRFSLPSAPTADIKAGYTVWYVCIARLRSCGLEFSSVESFLQYDNEGIFSQHGGPMTRICHENTALSLKPKWSKNDLSTRTLICVKIEPNGAETDRKRQCQPGDRTRGRIMMTILRHMTRRRCSYQYSVAPKGGESRFPRYRDIELSKRT